MRPSAGCAKTRSWGRWSPGMSAASARRGISMPRRARRGLSRRWESIAFLFCFCSHWHGSVILDSSSPGRWSNVERGAVDLDRQRAVSGPHAQLIS
ncbi:hypothetical protein VTK26DRAFT_2431 [Humicola hyalothermophila]